MQKIGLNPMTIKSPTIAKSIDQLSKTINDHRNQNLNFGNYLLESKPDSYLSIKKDLLSALEENSDYHKIYIIRNQINKDLGYILLKNYSDQIIDDPINHNSYMPGNDISNVEVSYRTLQSGVCAQSLRKVLSDYSRDYPEIDGFLGHHATDNMASAKVFINNGFQGLRYHDKYVYLPNIQEYSDTIMWILQRENYLEDVKSYPDYQEFKQKIKSDFIRLSPIANESHQKIVDYTNQCDNVAVYANLYINK